MGNYLQVCNRLRGLTLAKSTTKKQIFPAKQIFPSKYLEPAPPRARANWFGDAAPCCVALLFSAGHGGKVANGLIRRLGPRRGRPRICSVASTAFPLACSATPENSAREGQSARVPRASGTFSTPGPARAYPDAQAVRHEASHWGPRAGPAGGGPPARASALRTGQPQYQPSLAVLRDLAHPVLQCFPDIFLKVAVTVWAVVMLTEQELLVPVQAPLQPLKAKPAPGVAESVTAAPVG